MWGSCGTARCEGYFVKGFLRHFGVNSLKVANQRLIPIRDSYQLETHTNQRFIPIRDSYQSEIHTNQIFIPIRYSYQSEIHTNQIFIPIRYSYQLQTHTNKRFMALGHRFTHTRQVEGCCSGVSAHLVRKRCGGS